MVSTFHIQPNNPATMACRMKEPASWACGCPYSSEDLPALPIPFVYQCPDDISKDFLYHQIFGKVLGAQCLELGDTDCSPIPWVCPSCHENTFGSTGGLNTFTDEVARNCNAASKLLPLMIDSENTSLSQMHLLKEALNLLQLAPNSLHNTQETVHQMRDDAMREYFGPWFYHKVWNPRGSLRSAYQAAHLKNSTQNDEASLPDSEIDLSHSKHERAWLTEPVVLSDFRHDPLKLLDAFDIAHDNASHWIFYHGDSTTIHIARHMRQIHEKSSRIICNSLFQKEIQQAAHIRGVELPDLATLLVEQAQLETHLSKSIRKQLQSISDTHLELLSEHAANARKEAAVELLKVPTWIWRCRYRRYGSKTLKLSALGTEKGYVVLQIVPISITDMIHGDEPLVILP